jgi:Na+/melibiose symporter-like transporter
LLEYPPVLPPPPDRLPVLTKSIYGLGDMTINAALASLALVYTSYFLTQIAGLRPALAGLVPLVGRFIDAFTDPLMGRISDQTRWRAGRRRPYFLIAALPFGLSFAAMWIDVPTTSQAAALHLLRGGLLSHRGVDDRRWRFPYLALLPEMAVGYDERTSLNTYRNVGSSVGVFIAIAMRPLAEALGGGARGYGLAGALVAVLLAAPWPLIHRYSFERREFRERAVQTDWWAELRQVMRHRSFSLLTMAYLSGRIAMDLVSALMILYMTFWIGRAQDFEIVMGVFLLAAMLALPMWLHLARGRDKASMFVAGSIWWMLGSGLFLFATPEWSVTTLAGMAALTGIGFAAVDLMPWAMLGEVIDEDDLVTGERREGVYNGIFTFLRKLAGALAVFLALGLLDLLGFRGGGEQPETVRQAIRWMTGLSPPAVPADRRRAPLALSAHAPGARGDPRRPGRARRPRVSASGRADAYERLADRLQRVVEQAYAAFVDDDEMAALSRPVGIDLVHDRRLVFRHAAQLHPGALALDRARSLAGTEVGLAQMVELQALPVTGEQQLGPHALTAVAWQHAGETADLRQIGRPRDRCGGGGRRCRRRLRAGGKRQRGDEQPSEGAARHGRTLHQPPRPSRARVRRRRAAR